MINETSEVLMRRNGGLAFIVTVLIGYAQWASSGVFPVISLRGILLIVLGLLYLAWGILPIYSDIYHSQKTIYGAVFVEIALAMVIVYLGQGTTWLVIFPVISELVIILPQRPATVINSGIFILLNGVIWLWSKKINLELTFGLLCGMIFVILFSQIVVREQNLRTEAQRLNVDLNEANRKLQEYAHKVESLAVLQERNRLARDIHDGLGHHLTALNMQIKAAKAVIDQDRPRAIDALQKAQNLAEGAMSDIRNSVATLRGEPSLSQPLPDAIEALLLECRGEGLVADLITEGDYRVLTPQADLTLYRVAEESLTNIRKHALASRVEIVLSYDAGWVRLKVSDNGIGSDNPEGGFGLFGLRERVQLLNGNLSIRTAAQQGFCIEVELPG